MKRVFSLRWIVTGVTMVLVGASVAGVSAVYDRAARRAISTQVESGLLLRARQLAGAASGALLTDFPELTLHPLLRDLRLRQPELALLVVHDRSGTIHGHPDVRALGTWFTIPKGLQPVATDEELGRGESLARNRDLLVATTPVLHPGGGVLGAVWVGIPHRHLEHLLAEARSRQRVGFAAFAGTSMVVALLLVSLLLRPLGEVRAGIARIAGGDLDSPLRIRDRTELGHLALAVNDMAAKLKRAQAEMLERERLATEMGLARRLQRSLLPREGRAAAQFRIEGEQWAASEVGGDWYDVIEREDGRVVIAIADVSGKGLGGCLVAAMLAALVRGLRDVETSPATLLAAIDRRLGETLPPGSFVTLWYGVLDPPTGELVFASAGHNPPLVLRADGRVEWPRSTGIPLAAIRGGAVAATLRDERLRLSPGDLLVQYTDGINEAFVDGGDEAFGLERLAAAATKAAGGGARAVVEELHAAVNAWRGGGAAHDDETVVVLQHQALEAPGAGGTSGNGAAAAAPSLLAEARRRGGSLCIPATLTALESLRDWMQCQDGLGSLGRDDAARVELALHEACANIVEHGYRGRTDASLELWWLAEPGAGVRGWLVILDQAGPFRADNWSASDFTDPGVRRRGRGFGLDILHRVMSDVRYEQAAAEGNVTLLRFVGTSSTGEVVRDG